MYHQCPVLSHHLMSHHQCPVLPHLSTTKNLGIHPPTLALCRPMILTNGEHHLMLPLFKVQEFTSRLIHQGRPLPPLQPMAPKSVGLPVHPGEHRMEDTLAGHLSRIFVRAIYFCPE